MQSLIWQAQTRETRFEEAGIGNTAPFSAYKLVCVVDSHDFNEIYEMLNLWNQPEKVHMAKGVEGMRSLSVGDIVQHVGGGAMQVARFGFNPIKFDYTA